MRIHIFLFFSAILSISACQNITSENQSVPLAVLSSHQLSEILQEYTWSYTPPNSSVPILVNFSNQNASIYSGCNEISKPIQRIANHIKTNGAHIQTVIGCSTLETQEKFATQLFNDAQLEIPISTDRQKQLNIILSNGERYIFHAIPYISDLKNYDIEILKKFTWEQLTEDHLPNTSQILKINFTADRMLFFAGCNRKSQYYAIENKTLIPKGDFRSQVKFCGNTQHERQTSQSMSKPMNIRFDFSTLFPKLILESKYQPNMIFQAIPRKEDLKSS